MSSLVFLVIKSAKNSFLELLRKPAKLLMWIFVVAMIVGIFIVSIFTRSSEGDFLDLVWLKGSIFLLVMIFVVISIIKGLSNGDTIFDMSDVNLLFVSPVNSRMILMYGIVRMAKMAFLANFFILFQSNSLGANFGIGAGGILLILVGFILAVSLLQIVSLLIYSLTNGKPRRKLTVRLISVAIFLPLIIYIAVQLLQTGEILPALENTLRSPFTTWTPVAGWVSQGLFLLFEGDVAGGILFLGLTVVSGALLILYIALSNPDYYEDVLVATETTFEKKRSVSEGQINVEATSARKVKVTRTGIGGLGASTLFYKHLRESFRANRLGLWNLLSLIMVFGSALFSVFLRGSDGGILVILQILMWMQIFFIGTGRGLKELYSHYIYLIPESSFSKIIWSNVEIIFRVIVESLVIFSIAGFITRAPFLLTVAVILVYILFSFLLLGVNYLSLRWTGADISAGFLVFIYTIAVLVLMLPGLIAAIFIGRMFGSVGVLIGLAILALWELIAAIGCFALSKGVLHRTDMPVLKAGNPH